MLFLVDQRYRSRRFSLPVPLINTNVASTKPQRSLRLAIKSLSCKTSESKLPISLSNEIMDMSGDGNTARILRLPEEDHTTDRSISLNQELGPSLYTGRLRATGHGLERSGMLDRDARSWSVLVRSASVYYKR